MTIKLAGAMGNKALLAGFHLLTILASIFRLGLGNERGYKN